MEDEKLEKINNIRICFDEDNILPALNAETLEALGKKSKPVFIEEKCFRPQPEQAPRDWHG